MSCADVVICAGTKTSVWKEEAAVPSSLIPLGAGVLHFHLGVFVTLQAKELQPSYGSLYNPSLFPLPSQRRDRPIIFASPSRPLGAEGIRGCPGLSPRRLRCG